jgi:hypothetical protein
MAVPAVTLILWPLSQIIIPGFSATG